MNSLNQALVEGYVSSVRSGQCMNGVVYVNFSLKYGTRPFQRVACRVYGNMAERLLKCSGRKLPVRVVGRLDSFGEDGQFGLVVEHAEPLLNFELTGKGREAVRKNGGKIIVQSLESGYYDYTASGSMGQVLEELKKEVPFEDWLEFNGVDVGSAREDDLNDSKEKWEKELVASIDEYDLNDLIEEEDHYGIGVKLGYLQEIERDGPKINQVIVEGTVGNTQKKLSENHKDFFLTGKVNQKTFAVRCFANSKVDSGCLCQDGKGIRIVGRIHGCTITGSDGKARQGVEVLAEHIDRSPSHDVVEKQKPVRQQESGGMEW